MVKAIDTKDLRKALGLFPTGVTVVTTIQEDGTPRGFTANSFTSVSLDPPLLLICISKSAASLPVFRDGTGFVVNFLEESQQDISGLFASQRPDKFEVADWRSSDKGKPVIDDALAWFDCALENSVEAGDHDILIGRITDFGHKSGLPLGFLGGAYFSLGLQQSLLSPTKDGEGLVLGAILENDGDVLMCQDPKTNRVTVPRLGDAATTPSVSKFIDVLAAQGVSASVDFLYAVFEDTRTQTQAVYYRGQAERPAPKGMTFVTLDTFDWDLMSEGPTKIMLQRFANEHKQGTFAVYSGDDSTGIVQPAH